VKSGRRRSEKIKDKSEEWRKKKGKSLTLKL
jgi:hypothetical protein